MEKSEWNVTLDKMGTALLVLMKQKPFEKITADEIAAEAGVGRVTYFRNFSSKEDLLSSYLLVSYKRYCEEHFPYGDVYEKLPVSVRRLFSFGFQIQDVHRLIVSAGRESAIYEAYRKASKEAASTGQWQEDSLKVFVTIGLFGVIHNWIMSGCRQSPQEMTDWFLSTIRM